MENFVQYAPTEVIFGKGTENQTGEEVKKWGGSRVLLVYGGGSAVRSGLIGRVEQSLTEAGIAYEEFGGVKPNPRLAFAEEGVRVYSIVTVKDIIEALETGVISGKEHVPAMREYLARYGAEY